MKGFALVCLLVVGLAFVGFAEDSAPAPSEGPLLFFGGRLHTDASFYVQGGVQFGAIDATVGIGWNDSAWVGVHGHFLDVAGELSASVFSGVEFHIDNSGEVMHFAPAFAIGVAIDEGPMLFILDALIVPSASGEPVTAVVALSFNFGWRVGP